MHHACAWFTRTFEITDVPAKILGKDANYLQEGLEVAAQRWNGKCIGVTLPNTMDLKVVDTEPGVKGNTAQGVPKPATLETGAVVTVISPRA